LEHKERFLQQRIESFDDALRQAKIWYLDRQSLKAQRVKEIFDLIMVAVKRNDIVASTRRAQDMTQAALDFAKDSGYVNKTIFAGTKNLMLLAHDRKIQTPDSLKKNIHDLMANVDKSVTKDKYASVSVRRELLEMRLVAAVYDCNLTKCDRNTDLKKSLDEILDSEFTKRLERDQPGTLTNLKNYRTVIQAI
jgi:hypothetical protein